MRKLLDNTVFKMLYGIFKFIFFGILILYLAFIVVQRFVTDDVFGYRLYTVSSDSMKPLYEVGDVILVKETPQEEINVGDVVTYNATRYDLKGLTITHRIIKIMPDDKGTEIITTKGDANEIEDPSITFDNIIGVVQYKFTLFSIITKAIQNKYIFFFLAFVPLVLVLFLEVADTVTEMKDDKKLKRRKIRHEDKE